MAAGSGVAAASALVAALLVAALITLRAIVEERMARRPPHWSQRLHEGLGAVRAGDLLLYSYRTAADAVGHVLGAVVLHASLALGPPDASGAVVALSATRARGVCLRRFLFDDGGCRVDCATPLDALAVRPLLHLHAGSHLSARLTAAAGPLVGRPFDVHVIARGAWNRLVTGTAGAMPLGGAAGALPLGGAAGSCPTDAAAFLADSDAPLCCTTAPLVALRMAGALTALRCDHVPSADDLLTGHHPPLSWGAGFVGWGPPEWVDTSRRGP